jgi:NAD(P)-dependent dehydrogenase (short-subunit alcohol dehydrogenase family)
MALLDGKVALVTGAGRGLGRSHALSLAAHGATVFVNDVGGAVGGGGRDESVAESVAEEIRAAGGQAEADHTDISTIAAAGKVVQHAVEAFGRLDIVVNNAGITRRVALVDLDDEVLDLHLGVHLKGTVGTMKAAFPVMADQGEGSIVNTVSGAGLLPENAKTTGYACAKAAVYAATLVAAVEGRPLGVRVNAISPLAVTRMSEGFFSRTAPGQAERLDPARVSVVVAFLASHLAAGITGRILRVEGEHLCEAHMTWTAGVEADWTPELLAEGIGQALLA